MGMLDGQVVIVTGGAGGIGSAYCRGLAAEGAYLVVADLVDGSEMAAEAEELGAKAISVRVDVSDVASTEAMAAATVDAFGRIDALVNNAAFYLALTQGPMEEISPDEWDLCFEVNVKGSWLCARAVAPTMRAQKSGKIVNIASMTVNDGTPGFLHYVASKAAIWGLTRSLARELGDDGISVNTLTPDYIPHDAEYAAKQPHVDGLITARRAFKRTQVPDDMVGTLLYLVSPWSDFVTGQNIWVNGGSGFH
ncbi:MAG: SDR family oxidoreductase [bacterium]|nr:SDR family oxidoreductase [bacterium]MDE0439403.1 SDR family oxidoreductase [bacterium]